jgi:hypothetical protein
VTVILEFGRPWGRENPYPDRVFPRAAELPETALEDSAGSARDLSRRFVDDDYRRLARGIAIGLVGGISLWGVVALGIWFFW